jgi:aryl-alcohol dehydrogenase-like predicted oxidoreductase
LKEAGLVRHVGVCNVTEDELSSYQLGGTVEVVQNRLSLIDQEQDRAVRKVAASQGISLIPYNIIEWGLLTSRVLTDFHLRDGDLRSQVLPVFRPEAVSFIRAWAVEELVPVADDFATTIEGLAIAWATSQPHVLHAPVGATKVSQVRSSLASVRLQGNAELMHRLALAYGRLEGRAMEQFGEPVNEFLRNSFGRW